MGTIYRRKVRYCTRCDARLDTTAAWQHCTQQGHPIAIREQAIWWLRYRAHGRTTCESSGSADRSVAAALLRTKEGASDLPAPVAPGIGATTFAEAAADLIADYKMNGKRSLRTLIIRIEKHLRPVFGRDALTAITTSRVRAYILHRQAQGAANATVNRDLITLKRLCTLAVQGGKLVAKPYMPLLREQNIRQGFFEREQYQAITRQLPPHMQGIATFAFITGWRTPSEILPLEWRQVDLEAGEVRLDAGATKNGDGRVFPCTTALRQVLVVQQQIVATLQATGVIPTHVFCFTIGQKAGQRITDGGYNKAWRKARVAAGCPARIPHDFRRTAVRNLVRAGVPERVAMQLTGHKTRAVFERYNVTSPNDLRDAAQRLDAYAAAGR